MGRVSGGPGPVSSWGWQGEEGRERGPACLLGRGHTLRLSHGPQPCGHVCPARVDSTWGQKAQRPPKGSSRSLGKEESRKCSLIALGRKENTAKAKQAERCSSAKWLLLWACVPPGQGRNGRDTGPGSPTPCLLLEFQGFTKPQQHGLCSQVAWSGPWLCWVTLGE